MLSPFALALSIVLVAAHAAGQQSAASTPPLAANAPTAAPTAYYAGPGVTAPELLPSNLSLVSVRKCEPLDGVVTLSGVVNADGFPRDIKTLSQYETDLDKLAVSLVLAERFKPGTHDGIPAAVAITIEVGLQTCMKRVHGGHSNEANQLTLRTHPVQAIAVRSVPGTALATPAENTTPGFYKIGGSVSAPVPLLYPEAKFSKYARKNKISGVCLLGLIVDANGMPQNVHIIKSLEPSLDQNAIEAAKEYRFKPAMKDGTIPVPVVVNIEVNFRLY